MNPPERWEFASDNCSGMCPEAWEAMSAANAGAVRSYGDDPWTQEACDLIRKLLETDGEVFFAFNGTAANSLALASLCQSYHAVICHELAHVETDECGAPEFFSHGTKVLLAGGAHGKLDPALLRTAATKRTDLHFPRARALSLTQATELGTVYAPAEVAALCAVAREAGLRVHMDGARLANAVASSGASPAELTWKAGVDVLVLGGVKNGLAAGEAVVFFDRGLAHEFELRCKQAGQLASKMRYLAAPWVGLLKSGAWLRNARMANDRAAELETAFRTAGIEILAPRQANAVFAKLPTSRAEFLRTKGWRFYDFVASGGARFMCSWQTRAEDVRALAADLAAGPR